MTKRLRYATTHTPEKKPEHGGPLRYLLHRTAVVAVLDVPGWPLIARHVADSLERFAAAVQGSSDGLQTESGMHSRGGVGAA